MKAIATQIVGMYNSDFSLSNMLDNCILIAFKLTKKRK